MLPGCSVGNVVRNRFICPVGLELLVAMKLVFCVSEMNDGRY